MFPTKVQVHKEQAKLINAQRHLYGDIRLNMRVTIHNNANQTFWILYFLCFLIFDTKQVKNDKKTNKHSKLLNNKNSKNILECKNKQTTNNVTSYRKN